MKKRITWLVLVIVAIALGTWASSRILPFPFNITPATEPRAETELEWHSLNGPIERISSALALAPDTETLFAGTWGHSVYSAWTGELYWFESGRDDMRYVRSLAVSERNGDVVFAGTYGQGLWRSTTGGLDWQQMGSYGSFTAPVDAAHPSRNQHNIESLLILRDREPEQVLVGTHKGVWAGDLEGDTWTLLDSGFPDTDEAYYISALAQDSAGRLYAGTRAGLYHSRDGGQTWHFAGPADSDPPEAAHILSLAVVSDPAGQADTLLIGTRGAGIYALEDVESGAWQARTNGFPEDRDAWQIQTMLSTPDGTVYAGTVDNGILESADGGQTWIQRLDGLPANARSVTSLAWDEINRSLYAGTYGDGVYRLPATDPTWEAANTELPTDFPIQKMLFAGPKSEYLFVAAQVGGLYLTTERFETAPVWQRLPEALPVGQARDVVGMTVSGPGKDTIVVAAGTGLFRSTDIGSSWVHLGSEQDLPAGDVQARDLVQARRNSEILYAALDGDSSVYRTDNGGDTWRPAAGSLDEALHAKICSLVPGGNEDTLYLVTGGCETALPPTMQVSSVYTSQIHVTEDGGQTWNALSPIRGQDVKELDWSRRSFWDVFLYGGPQEILYARTDDGIYISYDGGLSWQLHLRGFFRDLLTDLRRPWMVYVASPNVILTREFESPINLTSDLWISYDGGQTWTWSGTGPMLRDGAYPASIGILASDPENSDRLYISTEGTGTFWTHVPLRVRAFTPRAVISLIVVLALDLFLAYVVVTGLTIGRQFQLTPLDWPNLAANRVFRATHVRLISDHYTPLSHLERLVLSLAPNERFAPLRMLRILNRQGILITFDQIKITLQRLASEYQILRVLKGEYQMLSPLLGRMARVRFWDDVAEREKAMKEQGKDRIRSDLRAFFRLAGFDFFSFGTGFAVTSNQPQYALLGADRGIYVHPHTDGVESVSIQEVRNSAFRFYEGQLAGKIAFLVVARCPQPQPLKGIVQLRRQEDFRLALLPYGHIRSAAAAADSCRIIDHSLERSLGHQDLFGSDGPVQNPFDFWGHDEDLQELVMACRNGRVTSLSGMAQVGKTSLARQVIDLLPNTLVAWVDLDGLPFVDLYGTIRQLWLTQAPTKFSAWEHPLWEPSGKHPTANQITDDLQALRSSLIAQDQPLDLVAVLDGLSDPDAGSGVLDSLAEAIDGMEDVSLLCIFSRPGRGIFRPFFLQPLSAKGSTGLIQVLAAQMGIEFDAEARDQLHQASGGHPRILRQLASRTILEKNGMTQKIHIADVQRAIDWYIDLPDKTLNDLWLSLTHEEQQVVAAIVAGQSPPQCESLHLLEKLGWLHRVEDRWDLFSQVVDRWVSGQLLRSW